MIGYWPFAGYYAYYLDPRDLGNCAAAIKRIRVKPRTHGRRVCRFFMSLFRAQVFRHPDRLASAFVSLQVCIDAVSPWQPIASWRGARFFCVVGLRSALGLPRGSLFPRQQQNIVDCVVSAAEEGAPGPRRSETAAD